MNFLAHALLASDDPALVVGGVAGDWVKGALPAGLPPDLARGVALHRAIDHHAETHPAFCRSRTRVSAPRRRYAGVLVDIFYDHLLARNWEAIHPQPLAAFCDDVYRMIRERLSELPEHSHRALALMADEDWLSSYEHIDQIADVLRRMSRRARQPNPLEHGEEEFLADAEGYSEDFHHWLTDTRAFCQHWLTQEGAGWEQQ
jgi:acyl carrier protein phosphodiesterase